MDGLFELVNSLTKGEKRMIRSRIQNNIKGDVSAYLTLFDVYAAEKTYDKKRLKSIIDEKNLNQLAMLKSRLYKLILGTIRTNYIGNKKSYEVRELVDFSDILIEKKLFDAGRKLLQKAQKIASKYDFLQELIIIHDKLRTVSLLINDLDAMKHSIDVQSIESEKTIKRLSLWQQYSNLVYSCKYNLIRNFRFSMEYDANQIAEIRRKLEELEDPAIEDLTSKRLKNEIWAFLYLAENRWDESIHCRRVVLEILNEDVHKIQDEPLEWLYQVKMLIASLSLANRADELKEEIDRFEGTLAKLKFPKSNMQLEQTVQSTIFMIRLNDFIVREQFSEAVEYLPTIFSTLKNRMDRLDFNNQQVLYYNITLVYFGNGELRNALKWVNKIIHQEYENTRVDVQLYARFLNIIVHFELKNYQLVESLVPAAVRYAKKVKEMSQFEQHFVDFAAKRMIGPVKKLAFQEFVVGLGTLEDRSFEEYFWFEKWGESHA